MKKLLVLLIGLMLVMSVGLVMAKGPGGKGDGDYVTNGYDLWGYNYGANMFNGMYCDYQRGGSFKTSCEAGPYSNDYLKMKWSDEWMTTKCGPDAQGRPTQRGCDVKTCECTGSSGVPGAWLTNHISWYDADGKKYEYFTKIVYNPDNCPAEYKIWGPYCIIQEVEGGLLGNYVKPVGLGYWTN